MDSLKVLGPNKVIWLNYTGSGNESAAHILENPRMTIIFCSFEKKPLILRLYGQAKVIHPRDDEWGKSIALFPQHPGARQLFLLGIDLVQTSCGFAVPFFDYSGERDALIKWADTQGEEGIHDYWNAKNQLSIDGFETKILEKN